MNPAQKALLEKRDGWDVGRDPRQVSRDELIAAGHQPMSPLKALRARCIDCCADQPGEVRLCTAVTCPSWPYRMGANPWREVSEGRRKAGRRLARERRPSAGNRKSDLSAGAMPEVPAISLPADPSARRNLGPEQDSQSTATASGEAVR